MTATVTILGCGGSAGVPSIGNHWGKCDPTEVKNRRTRSSILLQTEKTSIVVDTGPDFREQLNREDVNTIDAALLTHAHGDHINGLDELRVLRFRNQKLMPLYASPETLQGLRKRFSYLFDGGNSDIYPQVIEPHDIENGQGFHVGDIPVQTFAQDHGVCTATGYRFGDFGYSVDMLDLDDAAILGLQGIRTWVVDCTGYHMNDNIVHASLETVYRLNGQIGAKQVYLSSLTPLMDYQTLVKELKPGYAPCYDGLKIQITL